jgi:hypothetical protein
VTIAERLRMHEKIRPRDALAQDLREAADEIERLRGDAGRCAQGSETMNSFAGEEATMLQDVIVEKIYRDCPTKQMAKHEVDAFFKGVEADLRELCIATR